MNFQKITRPDLLNGSIFRAITLFTLPLFISYIFQQLYNSADTVIIGHYLGETSLAAIGSCTALYELLIGFGLGFGNGMSIVAARAYGAGDYEKLKKIVAASLIITFIVSFVISISTFFSLDVILRLLGTPEEIIVESFSYISLICAFCGVLFFYNLFSGILRAIGNSFTPLLFLIFSSVLNIMLDVIFMTKFGFGIKGAAIATVIAQFFSAVLCALYIFKSARILIPKKNHFKVNWNIYKDLIGQGVSMAFMGAIVHTGTVILQYAINNLGTYIIAGHVCSRKIFTLTNIPIITLGLSVSTFVSQNFGAGKIERIKKGVKCSVLITTVWTLFLLLILSFTLKKLVYLISGSENEVILNYATKYVMFCTPFYIVLGALIISRNALQGIGSKILPLISSIIEFFGKILFTIVIIPHLNYWGIIICEPLIWCIMMCQLMFVFVTHPIFSKKKSRNQNSDIRDFSN